MQQAAGLRRKCRGGRLAWWGRLPISLDYWATEWSCCLCSPGEAAIYLRVAVA